eukprot:TRINITY_DN494_c0_g1_i1.p1 TRINITY_DN494_c0_g1~~TRINITY_DN494_c0_g1_i1.p1  ORF type:complete len:243 (-),score=61.61 TRINITY_DN494_c0_g1_i1:84-812(-)
MIHACSLAAPILFYIWSTMGKKNKKGSDSEDSAVSESTRAVRRIQEELEKSEEEPPPKKAKINSDERSRDMPTGDESLGDGRKYGAVTGIKLHIGGSDGSRGSRGLSMKGKTGEKAMGMSLESMVNEDACQDRDLPDAPAGAFRRKDLEAAKREGVGSGKPSSRQGLDGKVYDFIEAPSDESVSEQEGQSKKLHGNARKEKGKSKKDKKGNTKHKKNKKQKKKKKGKSKKNKSSDSSSSSSS